MPSQPEGRGTARPSYFGELGFQAGVANAVEEILELYAQDDIPWIIGYSGGKDSTAVLQLVVLALRKLGPNQRTKPVHVISTDTMVENPIVAAWVKLSLQRLKELADTEDLGLSVDRLIPKIDDTYWVNLIGRGYPAPRPKFRWCTERLKISPVSEFIGTVVKRHREAIIVLGTRKAESAARAQVMNRLEKLSRRDRLRPHSELPNASVFSPIESWSNDDVWMFLMQEQNPWGHSNEDLLTMYRGATADGECPLVVDGSTPSCGDSRFGCWVCTMVDKDRSMMAMIQNDQEKEWMLPLLALRDELIPRDAEGFPADKHLRDFRRMGGHITLMKNGEPVPGPYLQSVREEWLAKLLRAQRYISEVAPEDMKAVELISIDEMRAIRRIWVNEKYEIEDSLPVIYEAIMGNPFPDNNFTDDQPIGREEISLLKEICGSDDLHFQLTRQLLAVEAKHRGLVRRSGLFEELEGAFRRGFYADADDATERAREIKTRVERAVREIDPEPYLQAVDGEPMLPGLELEERTKS